MKKSSVKAGDFFCVFLKSGRIVAAFYSTFVALFKKMAMKEYNNHFLNEVAIFLIMRFLRRVIRCPQDLQNYYFDLPQFEIDLCKAINELLVELNCPFHLSLTARFTCRGRSTVDRNIKKQPL
jgi:hypothetical protein